MFVISAITIRLVHLAHSAHCDEISGWLERVLNEHGARTPSVNETLCRATGADRCAFELRWSVQISPA